MKLISAVIRPARLPKLREAARRFPNFPGMTIDKVEGFSVQEDGPRNIKAELTDYSAKYRLLILSPDELVDDIVQMIVDTCATGERGDGHVWVSNVHHHVRIRAAKASQGI
jgi:nitrogen regulatory protein P-II 1